MLTKKGSTEIAFRPSDLITARYSILNRRTNDLVDILLGKISDKDDMPENLDYEIRVADIMKAYDISDKSNAYKYMQEAVEGTYIKVSGNMVFNLSFQFESENGIKHNILMFRDIGYVKGEGKIICRLDPEFKQLMLSATRGLFYKTRIPLNMKCIWAKRLYYYLADRVNHKKAGVKTTFVVEYENLCEMLQCPKSYHAYRNFKQRVLLPAETEINETSDIRFSYEEMLESGPGSGRAKVTGLYITVWEAERQEKRDTAFIAKKETGSIVPLIAETLACDMKEAKKLADYAKRYDVDDEKLTSIQDAVSEFVNESCISGKISAKQYSQFTKHVCIYGHYEIRLTVDSAVAYPATTTSGEKSARIGNNAHAGSDVTKYMFPDAYKDIYGNWVQPEERDYRLNAGDRVTVSVVRKSSITTGFARAFFGTGNSGTVITTYHNVAGVSGE